jgi:hypothetical protein
MELDEAIAKFKKDLAAIKADGKTQVEIANLDGYLDLLLKDADTSAEARRLAHENNLARYNAQTAHDVEGFKAVMAAGKEAINSAIIINGGAVFALMSFMAASIGKSKSNYLMLFAYPLFLFGGGVFCGGAAFGTRYISQFLYRDYNIPKRVRLGHIFNGLSWILIICSFLAFGLAVYLCYSGFLAS